MLWLLLWTLSPVSCTRTLVQEMVTKPFHHAQKTTGRPHIHYCRSPNMEDFTCWWHPLQTLDQSQEVSYVFTYSKDGGPTLECPDYVSGGLHSCHFDRSHTSIWKLYCMNVSAITAQRNYTSQQHCLDVAEIVQTEAPVNLSYSVRDAGGDELGHNVLLTWTYPVPSDLQYGWITLVYELRYRRTAELHNWKVKQPVREPSLELLGLPVGDYVVQVRSRSHNSGLWSRWSAELSVSVPARASAGKLLVLILAAGVGLVTLLVITLSVIPQSQRIKEYFLPPIPKPRIVGIDPLLLKKGHLDEINRHFSDFHHYSPPGYSEDVWDNVSAADKVYLTMPRDVPLDECPGREDVPRVDSDVLPLAPRAVPYPASSAQYCSLPSGALSVPSPCPGTNVITVPGTDYSVPALPPAEPPGFHGGAVCPGRSAQDFYTCIHLMNNGSELCLVPCVPPAFYHDAPAFPNGAAEKKAEEEEKKNRVQEEKKNRVQEEKKNLLQGFKDDYSEVTAPLLPPAVGSKS